MKRKTNLFYTTGPDSKFLTFSNYTESLTGNFVSTDHKLFPSKFICLNIPELCPDGKHLDDDKKADLIKMLAAYYENKMAVLRDDSIEKNKNIEEHCHPLAYLLECLLNYYSNDGVNIPYVGDITEEDYDGTYTDMICFINLENVDFNKSWKIISKDINNIIDVDKTEIELGDKLYGWDDNILDIYEGVNAIYDSPSTVENYYNYTTTLEKISKINSKRNPITVNNQNFIEFNIIIPLYDLVNINYKSNSSSLVESDDINLSENDIDYISNVPLGMWISDTVRLEVDNDTKMSPTWSLLISSQFKALPYYSKNVINENNDKILETSAPKQYNTFASIITRQNQLINKFLEIQNQIYDMNERLTKLTTTVNNINTTENIDSLHIEQTNFEIDMKKTMEEFKTEVKDLFQNLAWKATI